MKVSAMKHKEIVPVRTVPVPEVLETDPGTGLTAQQVEQRIQAGCVNTPVEPPSKTVGQIIASNIFTYFNLIFLILAAAVILVGSWKNLTFLFIVFANIGIGIVQELRSKKTLDKLNILSAPKATVIRDGKIWTVDTVNTVRDDITVFSTGNQIYADAVVVDGACQVNEALITGEADEVPKHPGDPLLSGSFVISGSCHARLTAVGADSFVSRLTLEAKQSTRKEKSSEMMRSLSRLVKWIGFIVIPFGAILAVKEILWLQRDIPTGVTSTVAALLGMIPEGLYLLTSLALVAGVMRLAKRQTLAHDMECIETLARVDTLCVDKTGTITENKMIVEDIVPLDPENWPEAEIRAIMGDYVYASQDDNDTMAALRRYFTGAARQNAVSVMPFTSAKKYGGIAFADGVTWMLGAPEILLGENYPAYQPLIDEYAAKGCRVLLLAQYDGQPEDEPLALTMTPVSLILLNNRIRDEAPATFRYFREQGVTVKVISGDNPATVSEVARRAEIPGAENYVDARTLTTEIQLAQAAEQYTVFGRVTPEQKRKLVRAMKEAGHTVAMTGDGVNDVLALKTADCSIAVASGSEVACQVSHIVLMNSDFSSLPSVVQEGRRVINNIERSASLYLVKNIFSFVLAFITLFATLPYPLMPSQLSLVRALTIGFPSFVLALEPNNSRIEGHFLTNVLLRAVPAAAADLLLIVGVLLYYLAFGLSEESLTTISTAIMGIVGLVMVHRTCQPYNGLRIALMIACSVAFTFAFIFLRDIFGLYPLVWSEVLILATLALLSAPVMETVADWLAKIRAFFQRHRRQKYMSVH